MLRPACSLPAARLSPPHGLLTPRSDSRVSPGSLGPATRRSDAYRDGTLTRWTCAACSSLSFPSRVQPSLCFVTHHAAIVGHPQVPGLQPQTLRGDGPTTCGSACPSWHCAATAASSGPGARFRRRLRTHHVTAPPTPARTSRPVANGANSSAHASNAEPAAARAAVPPVSAATPPMRGIAQQAAHAAPMPRTAFQGLIRPSPMPGQAAHAATVGPQAT